MAIRAGPRFGATCNWGKNFDITGQRERAVNGYPPGPAKPRHTQGALDEARRYMQKAFEREPAPENRKINI